MLNRLLIVSAWIGIVILAAGLRFHDLSSRPFHADEATGARILSERLENRTYEFNPTHFHGPLLTSAAVPVARLRGEDSWRELRKGTLRLISALAGVLLVPTALLWVRRWGHGPALAGAAFLATSPLLVYYSRMFIHESLFALFAMLALPAILALMERPSAGRGLLAGLCVGLMFATRETFVISMMAWSGAVGIWFVTKREIWKDRKTGDVLRSWILPAVAFLVALLLSAGFFYTEGFRNPSGMLNAVRTYFVYETNPGHEKAAYYYLRLLLWPKHELGMWWSEGMIGVFAALACLLAIKRRPGNGVALVLGIGAAGHLFIYSLFGYKTPWLMIVPWAHACLLAGGAFADFGRVPRIGKWALLGLLVAGLGFQTNQSFKAAGRFANDARNPYAYVPTAGDAERMEAWLQTLAGNFPPGSLEPVGVVGRGYWPLPWYLREFAQIGYWPEPDETLVELPLVFALQGQLKDVETLLGSTHTGVPRGLRENVPLMLYLRNDIWRQWMESDKE